MMLSLRRGLLHRFRKRSDVAACPFCRARMTVADGMVRPDNGDLTLCMVCLSPLVFDGEARPHIIDAEEWVALPYETRTEIKRLQAFLSNVRQQRRQRDRKK
jgi:hypothetical protein